MQPFSAYASELSGFFFNATYTTDAPQTQLLTLGEGLTAWARGLGLSPSERPEDDYLLKLASQYHAEQYEDCYRQMSECLSTLISLLVEQFEVNHD